MPLEISRYSQTETAVESMNRSKWDLIKNYVAEAEVNL